MQAGISFDDLVKHAFGFSSLQSNVNRMRLQQNFPPYNILVDNLENPKTYRLEIAVSGFRKSDISIKTKKDSGVTLLIIEGEKQVKEDQEKFYLAKGIASRKFTREFTLSSEIKIGPISLNDGILAIELSAVEVFDRETILNIE